MTHKIEHIVFEKNENVKELTLEQLKETTSLTDFVGKLPKSRPLEHFQFIEQIEEALYTANIQYEKDPIYVSKNDSSRIKLLDPDGKGNIKSWLFPRLVTRLNLIFGNNEKFNPSIAIGYNLNGLTVGYGVNTRICSNQSIFGNNVLQTWGKNSVAFEKLFNVFRDWLSKYDETFQHDVALLTKMEETQLQEEEVYGMIGNLQVEAVKNAYITPGSNVPFNIGQVSTFSKDMYNKHFKNEGNNGMSLYDFYNIGTNILKPHSTDIVDIWANNNVFTNWIVDKYGLESKIILN